MTVLRLIHICAGVLWAGWAFLSAGFIEPAARAAGPAGVKFMQALMGKTRLVQALTASPILVVLTGLLMYWRVSGNLNVHWLFSPAGLALTVGSLAGIIEFLFGLVYIRPAADKLALISREIESSGGQPSPEQLERLGVQNERLSRGGLYGAVLLAVCVIGMSLPKYL